MKFRCLALSAALLAAPLHAQTTQTEIQADLLQSQIQAAMQANDHAAAADLFDKYDALGVDMPPPLQKHRAVVYFRLQRYLDAERELQAYLERVERGSGDYRQAISMLTEVTPLAETARAEAAKARAEAAEKRKAEFAAIVGTLPECEGGQYSGDSLMEAVRANDCLSVKSLIEKGANVNPEKLISYAFSTPLHIATQQNARIAALLIQHGADVNAEDGYGNRPLHFAAHENVLEIAALLIQHGADVNAKSSHDGVTPLYWAVKRNAHETAALLRQHGGRE